MEVYNDHPQCLNEDRPLPVPSNAKFNAYLKEVADKCGINKYLTFQIARHSFATTVTLNNGVPILKSPVAEIPLRTDTSFLEGNNIRLHTVAAYEQPINY